MSQGLDIFFWTDDNGQKHVGFGKAHNLSPYNVNYALRTRSDNSIKHNVVYHHGQAKLDKNRYRMHNQIIRDYFENKTPYKKGEKKLVQFTGGGSASGKGTFVNDRDQYFSKNGDPVKIDSDELKMALMKLDKQSTDPSFYHEESTMLAKRIYEIALQNEYPVLFDGTASFYPGFMSDKVGLAKAMGYETEMRYMITDANTALKSCLDRYAATGRLVPATKVLSTHRGAQDAVPQLLKSKDIDNIKVYYRDSGNKITKIAEGGKGKSTIHDNKIYEKFLEPNAYNLDTGAMNNFTNQVAQIKARKKGN